MNKSMRQAWGNTQLVVGLLAGCVLLASPVTSPAEDFFVADLNHGGGVAALIAAINAANANGEADTIHLMAEAQFTLTAVDNDTDGPNGLPSITSEIIIESVFGGNITRSFDPNTPEFRLFHVAETGSLTLRVSTPDVWRLRNGSTPGSGGAIFNRGVLTIDRLIIVSENTAFLEGGGIFNAPGGVLTLLDTTVTANVAQDENGGGIANYGTATIAESTISENVAGLGIADEHGGGIYNAGEVTIVRSAISENSASALGGGIFNASVATTINSTISGNASGAPGGGVYSSSGTMSLTNCTVADNAAPAGGGINNPGSALTLSNTIVADNAGGDCSSPGPFNDLGYNIVEDGSCISDPTSMSGDPMLGSLAHNGRSPGLLSLRHPLPPTHELLPDSIAIDAGDCAAGTVSEDQCGFDRPRGGGCDIGAFEACPMPALLPAGDTAGLVAAMNCANETARHDVIELTPGAVYTLTESSLPTVLTEMTINAHGATIERSSEPDTPAFAVLKVWGFFASPDTGRLTINDATIRNGASNQGAGLSNSGGWVELNGCNMVQNHATSRGGALGNELSGQVTLGNCVIRNNTAEREGGGIYSQFGTLTLTNSTVGENTATGRGGGILNSSTATLTHSTVSGNTARSDGGGILNVGELTVIRSAISGNTSDGWGGGIFHLSSRSTATLTNSTVSGNTAGVGGGVYIEDGTLTLTSSTVSGNTARSNVGGGGVRIDDGILTLTNSVLSNSMTGGAEGGDCVVSIFGFGTVIDDGFNIIEDSSCLSDPTSMSGDPMLGPLADNGGPTMTHALLPDSIAIDGGDCAGGTVTEDQRGVPRPIGLGCDIGAFEAGMVASLDIKPGSCPNSFNRNGRGVLPVALAGSADFDVTQIDLSTLSIARADGIGGAVAPHEGPPGPRSTFEDVATPFAGAPCECDALGGDGWLDLLMKFRTEEMVAALELDLKDAGALVELVVSGALLDGTPFSAFDCVRLVPPGADTTHVFIRAGGRNNRIEVTPPDLDMESGGFGAFTLYYPESSVITLTAPPQTRNGRVFTGWVVDGLPAGPGGPDPGVLQITVPPDDVEVRAVYSRRHDAGPLGKTHAVHPIARR